MRTDCPGLFRDPDSHIPFCRLDRPPLPEWADADTETNCHRCYGRQMRKIELDKAEAIETYRTERMAEYVMDARGEWR